MRIAAVAPLFVALGLLPGAPDAAPQAPKAAPVAPDAAPQAPNGFDLTDLRVPRSEIVEGGPPRDGIRSVDAPTFVPVAEAVWVAPANPVLGLVLDTEAGPDSRVYPIHLIERHQVVNDRFGDRPVAVTYDPLTAAPRAFRGEARGQALHFGVSGLIHNHGFLMYDRETESLWSQFTGEAISGPLAGEKLAPLRIHQVTLAMWLERTGDARVLERPAPERIDYRHSPFETYMVRDEAIFPVRAKDDRFHLKELVLGVRADGKARAYLGSRATAAGGTLEDTFRGRRIRILYDTNTAVFDFQAPDDVIVDEAYWLGWKAFHPETEVWQAGPPAP